MKNSVISICLLALIALVAYAASVDGVWNMQGSAAGAPAQLVLAVNGSAVTGTAGGAAITNGKFENNFVWFNAVRSGVAYYYKGQLNGSTLTLNEESQSHTVRQYTYTRAAN